MDRFDNARYRLREGEGELVLPLFHRPSGQIANTEAAQARINRCAAYIQQGARRQVCRIFVYSEEEFEAACRTAGYTPRNDEGWWEPSV